MAIPSWLTISQLSGSGDTVITITASTNYDAQRYYDLIVSGITKSVTVPVVQKDLYSDQYLTFNITSDGVIKWHKSSRSATSKTIQYRINGGNWTNLTSTTAGTSFNVSAGDVVEFKGSNSSYATYDYRNTFYGTTAGYTLSGNIMSLIDPDGFATATTFTDDWAFRGLFRDNSGLTDASHLVLPVENLTTGCYEQLFEFSGLVTGPRLPSTHLAENCYYNMFFYCESLTTAPDLPAPTVYDYSYTGMFMNCTSLVNPPVMSATTMDGYACCNSMFENCTSLVRSPHLRATDLYGSSAVGNYENMFAGCTSLCYIECDAVNLHPYNSQDGTMCTRNWVHNVASAGTFVRAAGSTWTRGDNGIPFNWIVTPPLDVLNEPLTLNIVSAGSFTLGCFAQHQISSVKYSLNGGELTNVPTGSSSEVRPTVVNVSPGDKLYLIGDNLANTGATSGGLNIGTNNSGVKYTLSGNIMSLIDGNTYPSLNTVNSQFSNLFAGGAGHSTALLDASDLLLPATSIVGSGYSYMFASCSSMTKPPKVLPATTLQGSSCYLYMFAFCSAMTEAPVLCATTLSEHCYKQMFQGCSSLTIPPVLPATTLANYCYYVMFMDCTSLTTAPELPATALTNYCYAEMFEGCTSLTTAPDLPAPTLVSHCYYQMFTDCSSLNYIKCLATDLSARRSPGSALYHWVENVASTGTFVKDPSMDAEEDWMRGISAIPVDWNVIDSGSSSTYLTFNIVTGGTIVWNYYKDRYASETVSPATIEYRKNEGQWTSITATTGGTTSFNVSAGDKVEFRGQNSAYGVNPRQVAIGNGNSFSGSTAYFNVSGNIMSLIDYTTFPTTISADDTFLGLFLNTNVKSAASLNLPSSTAVRCFAYMFQNCTSLTAAPQLPATSMSSECYAYMFNGCTSLTTAPALPATTLASSCYYSMFQGCSNLTTTPALPATTLANDCYSGMFQNCTSLTTASTVSAVNMASGSCRYMYASCTALTSAPNIQITSMDDYCCESMFQNCTSLVTAPALPATTLAPGCYRSMFEGCTGLTSAPALPATIMRSACYAAMFYGCTSLVNAPALPATTMQSTCYYFMFTNCTSLTTAPDLPATTLVDGCYWSMFEGCSNLSYIKCLANTDVYYPPNDNTGDWVKGVAASGTFVKSASMSSWRTGDDGIPSGWSVQDA